MNNLHLITFKKRLCFLSKFENEVSHSLGYSLIAVNLTLIDNLAWEFHNLMGNYMWYVNDTFIFSYRISK